MLHRIRMQLHQRGFRKVCVMHGENPAIKQRPSGIRCYVPSLGSTIMINRWPPKTLLRGVHCESEVTPIECCHALLQWQRTNGTVRTCLDKLVPTGILHIEIDFLMCTMQQPHGPFRGLRFVRGAKMVLHRKRWTPNGLDLTGRDASIGQRFSSLGTSRPCLDPANASLAT